MNSLTWFSFLKADLHGVHLLIPIVPTVMWWSHAVHSCSPWPSVGSGGSHCALPCSFPRQSLAQQPGCTSLAVEAGLTQAVQVSVSYARYQCDGMSAWGRKLSSLVFFPHNFSTLIVKYFTRQIWICIFNKCCERRFPKALHECSQRSQLGFEVHPAHLWLGFPFAFESLIE